MSYAKEYWVIIQDMPVITCFDLEEALFELCPHLGVVLEVHRNDERRIVDFSIAHKVAIDI